MKIINLPREHRRNFITSKFNIISSQAQYPTRIDNERRWISYYDRVNNTRRKYRFNRYSLNPMQGSMMKHSFGMPSSSSLISQSRIHDSRVMTHSTVFHWYLTFIISNGRYINKNYQHANHFATSLVHYLIGNSKGWPSDTLSRSENCRFSSLLSNSNESSGVSKHSFGKDSREKPISPLQQVSEEFWRGKNTHW